MVMGTTFFAELRVGEITFKALGKQRLNGSAQKASLTKFKTCK